MRHGAAALAAVLLAGCATTPARGASSPEAVVQRQLDAYNRHDLDAFMATYADDAKVWRMPASASAPALDGAAAIRAFYRDARFNVPALHAALVARSVVGRTVADHERVTGLAPIPTEALAVYEVVDGRIANVWLYAP